MENNNSKKNKKIGDRLLVFEPNPEDNGIVPNEDLSIMVELKTTRKGRSVLTLNNTQGQPIENTGGSDNIISFINGSKTGVNDNGSEIRSLTTNYTNASVNFNKEDSDRDLEMLGIESIQINFDTAYIPLITINFIDIRGNAIFQQGSSSKYSSFFDMPYPIFELKVKGFYGQPVTYCLHLRKWNSNFNSETGNFEIKAEFIGYTYAILTDMLLGIIRAVIKTPEGKQFWVDAVKEYEKAGITLKSIDEFILDIDTLADEFEKLKNDDTNITKINNAKVGLNIIKSLKTSLEQLKSSIDPLHFNSENVLGTDVDSDINKKLISRYKDRLTDLLEGEGGYNTIVDKELTINKSNLENIKIITDLPVSKINEGVEPLSLYIKSYKSSVYPSESGELSEIIFNNITGLADDVKITTYDFRSVYTEISSVEEKLNEFSDNLTKTIGEELAIKAKESLGFESTIKSIVRMLTVHCEVFLKTLQKVSKDAEQSNKRKDVLINVLSKGNFNINKNDLNNKDIWSWPEYRKKVDDTYVESWLGADISNQNDITKVPELVFVNNLYNELLRLVESDERVINNLGELNGPQFYPISLLDTTIGSSGLVKQNPYKTALFEPTARTVKDEAMRCLIMRTFLFFSQENDCPVNDNVIQKKAELEAENLIDVLFKMDDKDIANRLMTSITETYKKSSDVIKAFNGSQKNDLDYPKISKNTDKKVELLSEDTTGKLYLYTYLKESIGNEIYTYLPISGNFNGSEFYNSDGSIKSDEELKSLSNNLLFLSSKVGSTKNQGYDSDTDDGGLHFRIIESDEYESYSMNPEYGGETFKKDNKETVLEQATIKASTYQTNVPLVGLDYFNDRYLTPEISYIKYNGITDNKHFKLKNAKEEKVSSVLCAYWQNANDNFSKDGTYLGLRATKNTPGYKNDVDEFEFDTNKEDDTFKIYPSISKYGKDNGWSLRNENYVNLFGKCGEQRELLGDLLGQSTTAEQNQDLVYVPKIEFTVASRHPSKSIPDELALSLFGSRFYYEQTTNEARAFLFLHSFSWNGLVGDVKDSNNQIIRDVSLLDGFDFDDSGDEDATPTIKGIFKNNAAFVKAPKLWCAFIGGLLYRYNEGERTNSDIIKFKNQSGATDDWATYYLPYQDKESTYPIYDEYLYDSRTNSKFGITLFFDSGDTDRQDNRTDTIEPVEYVGIDNNLINLPKQVKNEFIRIFNEFVGNEFIEIRKLFEIYYTEEPSDFNYSNWKTMFNGLNNSKKTISEYKEFTLTTKDLKDNIKESYEDNFLDTYSNVSPCNYVFSGFPPSDEKIPNVAQKYQFKLMNRYNSAAANLLNDLIKSSYYIMNHKPSVFAVYSNQNDYIYANKQDFEKFIDSFLKKFEELSAEFETERKKIDDRLEQKIFNTTDDDLIKLNLYRTLGSINTKWVTSDKNLFNPGNCGCNSYDKKLSNQEGRGKNTRLIDSFRFLDRAYNSIGDEFYINPIAIRDSILGKYNKTFFNLLSEILSNNNFTFIGLPTYVNYSNLQDVIDVFKPYPYSIAKKRDFESGPSYICTYVGQTSTHLDLGENATYPDDGVTIRIDDNGNYIGVPEDFSNERKKDKNGHIIEDGTMNIPFFLVSYARQNQSYFKNIKLDQSEFTETAESLEIIEDLSSEGKKTKPSYVGQNLWNVYQKRAYTCQVSMMGNAMIQPMMYFHLDDIPMFRGAYNIYKVSHTITPHNMQTNFTGTRVKRSKTPLIDRATLFGNLLGDLTKVSDGDTTARKAKNKKNVPSERLDELTDDPGSINNYVDTPIDIKLLPINDSEVKNTKIDDSDGFRLQKPNGKLKYGIREVAELLQKTFKDFNTAAQGKNFNDMVYINDISYNGGGVTSDHLSHQIGVDIDLRQITNVKGSGAAGVTFDANFFQSPSNAWSGANPKLTLNGTISLINPDGDTRDDIGKYSRAGTRLFIKTLIGNSGQKVEGLTYKSPEIDTIWFNDPVLINEFPGKVKPLKSHNNHLHIRFKVPERVEKDLKNGTGNSRQFKN